MILGEAQGDDGDRLHSRIEGSQVGYGAGQMLVVVQAGDEDDLGMNLDAQPPQPLQLLDDVGCSRIAQDAAAQSEISSVDGNVEGTETLLGQAIPVVFGEVGESYVIAKEEGIAIIVVFYVKGTPHPPRHPLEEAEFAAIVTKAKPIESRLSELDAQLLIVASLYLVDDPLSAPSYDQFQLLLSPVEAAINDVTQDMAIDGEKHIARL
jgi:hypothetical protein